MQNPQSMDYKYPFICNCPPEAGNTGILNQMFVDATKITNFWSQSLLYNRHKHCCKKTLPQLIVFTAGCSSDDGSTNLMGVTHFTVVVMYKLWFNQHNTHRNWTRVHKCIQDRC